MNYEDDYTAAHEVRPYMVKLDRVPVEDRELVLTRAKLEMRTFIMRLAIGLLAGTWTGFAVALATGKIEIT